MNRKSHEACNFNCFVDTEELFKVTCICSLYAAKVVISSKTVCKIEMLLITNL